MNKKIYIIALFFFFCSCNNPQGNSNKVTTPNKVSSAKKFNNSTWVYQGIGENGKIPDTIIFKKGDKLLYIGHEPNVNELCPYSLNKDTLIFISHVTIYDPKDFEKEIICEYHIKTLIKEDTLTYISSDMKNPSVNSSKHFDYIEDDVRFKRIKKNAL